VHTAPNYKLSKTKQVH